MRKFLLQLRRFFLPAANASLEVRILPFAVLGIITVAIGIGGIATWNYTNSNTFCGTSCHTMPPQYSSYERSSHSRVDCVECHLGRDQLDVQVTRKIAHSDTAIALLFNTYQYPIVAKKMRPANEACETCHYPLQFEDDSLVELKSYSQDQQNTPSSTFLILKTGGGTKRQGLGLGIHWHIENKVTFLATDELQQNIPYVRVEDENGKITEYYDAASGFTPDKVAGQKLQNMDCITCHNRATHEIPTPEDAVAQALDKKLISPDLPFINQQAIALLRGTYPTQAAAFSAIDNLKSYYSKNFPQVYSDQPKLISQASATLKTIYTQIRYPEQKLDWTSHPDNIGHQESAGCFRCHDGKHFTSDGQAIRLECNLCHSIPVQSDPAKFTTNLEVVRGPEPASHTHTSWIGLHGKVIDATCVTCHPPANPATDYTKLQGKPPIDGSFCGNSVCHSTELKYAGINSPTISPILAGQLKALTPQEPTPLPADVKKTYVNMFKGVFTNTCGSCHSGAKAMAGLDLTTYASILQGTKEGAGIVPGDPAGSLIYKVQEAGDHFGQLTPDELTALKDWITSGAPEN